MAQIALPKQQLLPKNPQLLPKPIQPQPQQQPQLIPKPVVKPLIKPFMKPADPGEEEIIRVCVLGASGVGKSTLCNFLCDQQVFPTGSGFDACTVKSMTHNFTYKIDNIPINFEVTDTPGWFDADNERLPSIHTMLRRINDCIKISENGICAYFIVIPYERASIDTEQSIYFMRDCFDSSQLRHVYMIFTKAKKNKNISNILSTLLEQKNKGRRASGLIYNYAQTINEQCFATECEIDDEKELHKDRNEILIEMHKLYKECGIIPDGVFSTAQKNYKNEIDRLARQHRKERKHQASKYQRMLALGTVIGVGFVAAGINGYAKYNSVVQQNGDLVQQTGNLVQQTDDLKAINNDLINNNNQLQDLNNDLQKTNKQNEMLLGVSEAVTGALWFAIEPISGSVAVLDGLYRAFGYSD